MILKNKILTKNKRQGRNNLGKITIRHRGGGAKRKIRILKNIRSLENIYGIVKFYEYDPNRNSYLSIIFYQNGAKEYALKLKSIDIGTKIIFSENIIIQPGNSTYLTNIPTGTKINNLEFRPFSKSRLARSGDSFAVVLSNTNEKTIILLPSKEIKIFNSRCIATIGVPEKKKQSVINKAGRSRLLGIRPTVRGSAMNAVDHPHGGGEGKAPIGRKQPLTPWGKKTLGIKTRKKGKVIIIKKK